ncbi:MAG: hypothetical protein J6A01_06975 [Proteobacteria bacterium]|nr:hypothetical protein [Pseudomonadota bacterium]
MYTLPDAPPKAEWQTTEQKPQETQEDIVRRFLDSKRAAIQCYAALADGDWERAMSYMSAQTQAFFENHSNGNGASSVFETNTIYSDAGEELAFDPVGDVFIRDLADIRDDFGGRQDDESQTRKVLYAVSASGQARELVFILEEDKWRLDSPHLKFDLLSE